MIERWDANPPIVITPRFPIFLRRKESQQRYPR